MIGFVNTVENMNGVGIMKDKRLIGIPWFTCVTCDRRHPYTEQGDPHRHIKTMGVIPDDFG